MFCRHSLIKEIHCLPSVSHISERYKSIGATG